MEYTIYKIKKDIIDLVVKAVEQEIDAQQLEVTVPPSAEMGDLAVPCFYLTKLLRISPNQVAHELKEKIHAGGIVKSVQNVGPYLNFFLDYKMVSKKVLKEIDKMGATYGSVKLSKTEKKKVMIEYSSPNTHKEFHVGHLRNVALGSVLVNLWRYAGHQVIATNYVGDIGSHVAKCLWALEKFHQDEQYPENKGKYLGKIYTEAVNEIDANPEFKKEADEVLQKLEHGDKKWLALWKETRQWSLDEFDRIYKILDIKFDKVYSISKMEKPGKKIVEELLQKGIAEKSEGATVINLEKYNLKYFLLLKSDGSSLYATSDLALAQAKFKKYNLDESIVLVDTRQSFYFEQLFQTLKVMGFDKPMVHVPYEFVTLKEGAMSSRAGNVVLFDDFFVQVKSQAMQETKKRHDDWSEKKTEETAEKIALSAIKFQMLKTGNNNVIVFDIDEALSFDGTSGPYLQYTVSRINSILNKEKPGVFKEINYNKLNTDLEKEMISKLASFPESVAIATSDFQPSHLTQYLFELAKLFSSFYQSIPILSSEAEVKNARLALIVAVRQVLTNGLTLLGIETLDQM